MARPPSIQTETRDWVSLDVSSLKLTDDQLIRLFHDNEEYQFELSASRELIIMTPAHNKTELLNLKFASRLFNWAERDGTGVVFGNNTLFTLPNGAKRGPDASWVSKARWDSLSEEEKNSFSNLVPEFVVELRSRSDRLKTLKPKMDEYMTNGVQLAWLLDPIANSATIYRANEPPIEIASPSIISGDPVLPGFKFDFRELL